jgi:hypothetical protein
MIKINSMDNRDIHEILPVDPLFEQKWTKASNNLTAIGLPAESTSEIRKRMEALWLLQGKVQNSELMTTGRFTYDQHGYLHDEQEGNKQITRMFLADTFFELLADSTNNISLRAYLNLPSFREGGIPDGENLVRFMDKELGWTVGIIHGHHLVDDLNLRMAARLVGSPYVNEEVEKYIMTPPMEERELSLREKILATLFERVLRDSNSEVRNTAMSGLLDILTESLQLTEPTIELEEAKAEINQTQDLGEQSKPEELKEDKLSENELELCELLGGLAEVLYDEKRYGEMTPEEKENARQKFETILKQGVIFGPNIPIVGAFIDGPLTQYAGKEKAEQFSERFVSPKAPAEKYNFSTFQIFRNIDFFV